jgi:hypothetical protein
MIRLVIVAACLLVSPLAETEKGPASFVDSGKEAGPFSVSARGETKEAGPFSVIASRPAQSTGVPTFEALLAHPITLKPELVGVHPRVFVTTAGLERLRQRARTTHKAEWSKVLGELPALTGAPPPPPGPQERRSQNNVAFAIAGVSLAYAVERQPQYLAAAKTWTLAAIDYEPWGYTYNKPNIDLAAGHLLYAIGWAYDLLHAEFTEAERARIRASLERHAALVYDALVPKPKQRLNFTQNHDFIPTSGLAVTALALMGESRDAEKWAALARAHHHRANQLLSPDGYYYEGMEYWIFSIPWLVHFYDAWQHSTGEDFWSLGPAKNWKYYLAHTLLPDGQNVFDFGDIWEGPLTRAKKGVEFDRVYPGGTLQSNYNVMYGVAAHFKDPDTQAVAARYQGFGHSNLEEYWTLIWRDPSITPSAMDRVPRTWHFEDMGVVYTRTSWNQDATAVAFKAGPPEGHRAARLASTIPEWGLDSGHSHPDNGSFIIWARGKYLTGDTGYAGLPQALHHNTITVGGVGQGVEGQHDVWRRMNAAALDAIRIRSVTPQGNSLRIEAEVAAAYPDTAGLQAFTRLVLVEPTRVTVQDDIATAAAKSVQWYFHSDDPITRDRAAFVLGGPNGLRLTVEGPDLDVGSEPTILMAPGQPGSITKGEQEQRGFHVKVQSKPATSIRLKALLELPRN